MWNTSICKFLHPYPYYACTYAPVSNTYVSMPLHPPSKSEIKELRTCSAFLLNDFSRKQLSEGVTNCAIKTALNISLRTFPPCSTLTMSLQLVIKKRLRSTVRVIIKFPPNTRIRVRASNKCTNGRPQMHKRASTDARTGIWGKRVRVSDRFWKGRPIERERGMLWL